MAQRKLYSKDEVLEIFFPNKMHFITVEEFQHKMRNVFFLDQFTYLQEYFTEEGKISKSKFELFLRYFYFFSQENTQDNRYDGTFLKFSQVKFHFFSINLKLNLFFLKQKD